MASNKVVIANEEFVVDEDGEVDSGSGGVTPGELVDLYGNADYDVHATAGEANPVARFARKAGEIGDTMADDYAAGDWIKVARCLPGVKVTTWLAAGENVAEGEGLSSNGDGTLRSAEDGTSPDGRGAAVAAAAEAVDNSGGSSAVKIEAEVL